jgi:cold shock CspA family protein
MIKNGKITSWNDDKGYGFITPSSGEGQVFAHIKAFKYQARRPEVNRSVTYILSTDTQGRICAAEVIMVAAPVVEKNDQGNMGLSIIFAGLFLVIITICGFFGRVPSWAFVLYLTMSLITYVFYYRDKSAAQKGTRRTPENT